MLTQVFTWPGRGLSLGHRLPLRVFMLDLPIAFLAANGGLIFGLAGGCSLGAIVVMIFGPDRLLTHAGVIAVATLLVSVAGSVSRAPALNAQLVATAEAALSSAGAADNAIALLHRNGVGVAGVTRAIQISDHVAIRSPAQAREKQVLAAFDATDLESDLTPPSHAQQCALLRLLIGTARAEPNGHCRLSDAPDALARRLSDDPRDG